MASDDLDIYNTEFNPTDTSGIQGMPGGSLLDYITNNPKLFGTLLGAAGPTAGLFGNLISGGQTGSQNQTSNSNQNGTSNQTGSNTQSGFQNTNGTSATTQTGNTSQTGFQNGTSTPTLNPNAQAAIDRLNGMLTNTGGADGAYNSGLSMLMELAKGQMASGSASTPVRPNTTPSPAGVTGFPTELPTAYNAGLGNLIKQAFGSMTGDIASSAITNARNRGFAGGADLLGTAAAPIAGQALAEVPAQEAKAYLDHVLQAYGLQTQNAVGENAARANSLNAATNALGPGVSMYNIDRQANNQQAATTGSLLQALMAPHNTNMNANLSLATGLPHGTETNTLTGSQGTNSLSGVTTNNSQTQTGSQGTSNQQGTTTGNNSNTTNQTQNTPIGNTIGTGIGNIIQGGAVGLAANDGPKVGGQNSNQSLLALLAKLAGKG